ncbi:hypothetical protein FSP39_012205 [Pinctada imbricata]|uniref:Sialate O-acetylesterase domain-containing protein n=1 Tax=Pinctada imbricata TaxID=66713 RepID=A0AA89C774_PINIB|nr:hypothetical protein FSP39_012205 [Pinctada imbricata]
MQKMSICFPGDDVFLQEGEIVFASYYGDHMVLQRAPQRANVWGYLRDVRANVTLTLRDKKYLADTYISPVGVPVWRAILDPVSEPGPYDITVSTGSDNATIRDILFGDLWLCSGQSNMQFTVGMSFSAKEEFQKAANYTNIRMMTVNFHYNLMPLYDFGEKGIMRPWSLASREALDGPTFHYFSAVCWMYGRMLYDSLQVPIGLISSSYGGTIIEAWSSPDALQNCNISSVISPKNNFEYVLDNVAGSPNDEHVLWNAMIHPLLNLTIYGVIWYQGESNTHHPDTYNCTFPAMINDWREKFYEGSNYETNFTFPFGFVQIGPDEGDYSLDDGFPDIRWHQTADYGFVPNPKMKNTFMAVAMDMSDFATKEPIHFRDKIDVARRLVAGGLHVAYGKDINYVGPFPSSFNVTTSSSTFSIEFKVNNVSNFKIQTDSGFEICCSFSKDVSSCINGTSWWIPAPIVSSKANIVTLTTSSCSGANNKVVGVRYAWRKSPCPFKKCAIYEDIFPAPPFQYSAPFP